MGLDWNQWTIIGEILTKDLDFRVNFYIPGQEKLLASSIEDDAVFVSGNQLVYQRAQLDTYYQIMGGYDFEFGKRFIDTENIFNNVGAHFRIFGTPRPFVNTTYERGFLTALSSFHD